MSKSYLAVGVYLFVVLKAAAQTSITSDPVGLTTTSCLAKSDTYVSIPFTRPSEFVGTVRSVGGNTITVNGTPGWENDQFVYAASLQPKHYYVLIGNGCTTNPKEGHVYQITGNGPNTLLVDATSDNLTGIAANTQVTVIPYWTLATIFPAPDAGVSFTPTSSPPTYQTLLRFPNYSAPGINQPYTAEYYFNNGAWRLVSDGFN